MSLDKRKRIGLFVYDWGMYHYIKDLATELANAGFCVDLFFKDWDLRKHYADIRELATDPIIRLYDFTTKVNKRDVFIRRKNRVCNRIAILLGIPRNHAPQMIIDSKILALSKEIIGAEQYYCYIGIEKKGLIWAGILAELNDVPLIYYSLELYLEDNPVLDRVYHILSTERKFHKKSIATIVQDQQRAQALLKGNGIQNAKVLYLPVSSRGTINRESSHFLHDHLNIPSDKKIILYFGGLDKSRFIGQIVRVAANLDDDMILVLHGFGPKRYIKHLLKIADKTKVKFSFDIVPEDQIVELISSAHIGIALYKTTNVNDRLVAFSASKIAYYMQCGVPMITFDTESFRELSQAYHCVELISDFDEIPRKARLILKDFDLCRKEAFAAYERYYNFENNFASLIKELETTVNAYYASNDHNRQ